VIAGEAEHDLAICVQCLDLDVLFFTWHASLGGRVLEGRVGGFEVRCCACDEGAERKIVEHFTAIPR
jgi:hypothetical protein